MAKQPIIINVTTEKPLVEITNFVPSPSGSFGSALTAIQSDTAVSASFAVQSNFAISASHALRVSTASFAFVAQDSLGGSGSFSGSYTGTFEGDGTGLTGIVAQSTQSTADTASYMAGANVDGQVESASLAQAALLAITASFVESSSFATRTISASHAIRAEDADRADSVAFDNVTNKPTLVSESIQVDHNDTTNFEAGLHFSQPAIVQVGNVVLGDVKAILPTGTITSSTQINDQLDLNGASGSFTGSFIGDGAGITGVSVETASYVAGAGVDGPVESAQSASYITYGDVRDTPALISSSAQFDVGDDFVAGQIDAVGVSGSFLGTGQGITGIVLADSATLALAVSGTNVVGAVANADTASLATLALTANTASLATLALTANTASFAELATSASHAIRANDADEADAVSFDNVTGKPTLISESIQVDHDATFNFDGAEHFLQSAITEVGIVVAGDVDAILPVGTLSASAQITGQLDVTGVSGSFTGSFAGDGTGLTGITADSASDVAYDNVRDKPTLVSASIQVDHDATTNFDSNEHFLQSAITEVGNVVTGDVDAILPVGTLSASAQIKGQLDVTGVSGSFTGSFVGDGAGMIGISADSASDVAYADVRDKPTLISASIQVDHDATTNFEGTEHFLQSAITEVGTVVTGDVDAILPVGTLSSSAQITGQLDVTGVSGSFTGSFIGDGTGMAGITADSASDVAYDDVRDKPALVSASIQVDHDATFNFESTEHFLQSAITEVGTVVTGDVDAILPVGTLSSSAQIKGQLDVAGITGSFTGSIVATGSLAGTASFADTAQIVLGGIVNAETASYVAGGNVAGLVNSASFAITASFAENAGGAGSNSGSFTGSFIGDGSELIGIVSDTAVSASHALKADIAGALESPLSAPWTGSNGVAGAFDANSYTLTIFGQRFAGLIDALTLTGPSPGWPDPTGGVAGAFDADNFTLLIAGQRLAGMIDALKGTGNLID